MSTPAAHTYTMRYDDALLDDVAGLLATAAYARFRAWKYRLTLALMALAFAGSLLAAPRSTLTLFLGLLLLLNLVYWATLVKRLPRKVAAGLKPLVGLGIQVRVDGEGVLAEADGRSSFLPWREVKAAWERPGYFLLAKSDVASLVLPLHDMPEDMRAFIRETSHAQPA